MKFSEFLGTPNLNEGYDLKSIKDQIVDLFKGKIYGTPEVLLSDGAPEVAIDISAGSGTFIIILALDKSGKDLYINVDFDYPKLKDFYKYVDKMESFVKGSIVPNEEEIIEILKSN